MTVIRYDLVLFCIFEGIKDYLHLPFVLISLLNPFNVLTLINLFKFDMEYDSFRLRQNESLRRHIIRVYFKKTISHI